MKILKSMFEMFKEFWVLAKMNKPRNRNLFFAGICAAIALSTISSSAFWLLLLIPVAFTQNLFFTMVSRSRNSNDPDYHRFCAWSSNGVWFICQVLIVKNIWSAIHDGNFLYAAAAGVVYSLATTEGSVFMMKHLIANETGKRRVGANKKIDAMEDRINALESIVLDLNLVAGKQRLVDAIGNKEI